MNRILTTCPCCGGNLHISALQCSGCGVELKNDFSQSKFDMLSNDQYQYLLTFLKNRGNLKIVQNELGISYPTAKKRLDELLINLDLADDNEITFQEGTDMVNFAVNRNSVKASEIIKARILDNGGRIVVHTLRGLPCEIIAANDGKSFVSKKLPIKPPYEYKVFDVIVDLLLENGGRARKGNGRNYKFGHPECDSKTVVGAIALNYAGKKLGDSVFDPVFALAAVMEWAGIVNNERGELVLTQTYRNML